MEELAYKIWYELHIRAARQEALMPDKRAAYDAGLRQLYAEEFYSDNDAQEIQADKARIAEMEAERQQLREEYRLLQAKAAALEVARAARQQVQVGAGER